MKLGVITQTAPTIGGGFTYEETAYRQIEDSLPGGWRAVRINKNDVTVPRILSPGQRDLGKLERSARKAKVDLLYFLSPMYEMANIQTLPFIATVWDVGHITHTSFPEFAGNHAARIDQTLSSALPKSHATIVDSSATSLNLLEAYEIDAAKIHVGGLPLPAELKPQGPACGFASYIIYPSRGWAHKNHGTLFAALRDVDSDLGDLMLVLTGLTPSETIEMGKLAYQVGVEHRVKAFGHIERGTLLRWIRESRALVMPSLLGPTNYPPLEAMALGVPAIISDAHRFDFELPPSCSIIPGTDSLAWGKGIVSLLQSSSAPRFPVRIRNHFGATVHRVLSEFGSP